MSASRRQGQQAEVERSREPRGAVGVAGMGAGAALLATLASACCLPVIAPLLVAVAGVGGAVWVAGLKPYSPYLLGGSLAILAYAFWAIYRPARDCADDACRTPRSRGPRVALWTAALLWTVALVLNLVSILG